MTRRTKEKGCMCEGRQLKEQKRRELTTDRRSENGRARKARGIQKSQAEIQKEKKLRGEWRDKEEGQEWKRKKEEKVLNWIMFICFA